MRKRATYIGYYILRDYLLYTDRYEETDETEEIMDDLWFSFEDEDIDFIEKVLNNRRRKWCANRAVTL